MTTLETTARTMTATDRSEKIAQLNDEHRRSLTDCVLTCAVAALPRGERDALLRDVDVAEFDLFDPGNDPYGEHDFGALTFGDERFFWKIDYYDVTLTRHSPDPCDPRVTRRVMTVMMASEY